MKISIARNNGKYGIGVWPGHFITSVYEVPPRDMPIRHVQRPNLREGKSAVRSQHGQSVTFVSSTVLRNPLRVKIRPAVIWRLLPRRGIFKEKCFYFRLRKRAVHQVQFIVDDARSRQMKQAWRCGLKPAVFSPGAEIGRAHV